MAEFETHDEAAAEDIAADLYGPRSEWERRAFAAGWIASRAWHRERNEREVEAAAARLLERRDEGRPEPVRPGGQSAMTYAEAVAILKRASPHGWVEIGTRQPASAPLRGTVNLATPAREPQANEAGAVVLNALTADERQESER